MAMPPSLEGFPDNFPHLPSSKGKGCYAEVTFGVPVDETNN